MKSVGVAIIGAGPRGLAVLERLSALIETDHLDVRYDIRVIDPGRPGQGIHRDTQPAHLLANTAAGSTTVFVDASVSNAGPARPGPNLRQWLDCHGYRRKDGRLEQTSNGGPVMDDLFVPRAILGRYLNWAYEQIVGRMPSNVDVRHHAARARAISRAADDRFSVALSSGDRIDVDFVFLTTGHSGSGPRPAESEMETSVDHLRERNPKLCYMRVLDPIERLDDIGADARVAICGIGLTALDAVSMFTHGRRGRFSQAD